RTSRRGPAPRRRSWASARRRSPAAPPRAWTRPTAHSPWRSPAPPSSPCAPDGASHADPAPHRSRDHARRPAARRAAQGRADELRAHPCGLLRLPAGRPHRRRARRRRPRRLRGRARGAWPEGPDAIVVTSANAHHKDLVLEAARRGVHVLCEKPLATTVADAEAMVAACREVGVVLMTAFPVHFSPAVEALRTAVADGTLGEVIGLTGTNNGKLPAGRDWFTDVELAGGGSLVDHTVHIAEILDAMFGEPATVHAVSNRILYADRAGEGAETGGLVTLGY